MKLSNLILLVTMLGTVRTSNLRGNEQHFAVVTASYNNASWYRTNLDSVFSQKYQN